MEKLGGLRVGRFFFYDAILDDVSIVHIKGILSFHQDLVHAAR